ncbi:MAG: hypothetical protein JNK64_28650 [Myxococcales bacterium]|nr:hypothetical protein [Myxococcales bacterium]
MLAEECPNQVPRDVRLDGVGEIDGAGVAVVRGLVDVYAYEAGGTGNVVVQTRCDAWLPFDLRGRPQRAVSDTNAPRLRAALEEIEDALGIKGQANKGKYSRCEGYTVVNLFEVGEEDEEPIDVFDYGLDESWFVTP